MMCKFPPSLSLTHTFSLSLTLTLYLYLILSLSYEQLDDNIFLSLISLQL